MTPEELHRIEWDLRDSLSDQLTYISFEFDDVPPVVILDGHFTIEDLEHIASYMRNAIIEAGN